MNRRHLLRAAFAASVAAAAGAGCSEPAPPGAADLVDPGTPAPRPSPTPSRPAAPLTGAPATSDAVALRPALAVPVRVAAGTAPAGLAAADVLYQEYAEGGSLHLTAVFQSRDAARIGPVAEIRPVDIRTVEALRPFVGYAGGPTGFLAQFADSGLRGVTPGQRAAAFSAGYTSTAGLYRAMPAGGAAPTPVFDYATPGTPLAGQDLAPAARLTVTAPGHPPQVWAYDAASGTWRGRLGTATVAVASVIVLTMPYRTLEVRKPAYRVLPGATVFGTGAALAVSGPVRAKAAWRKAGQKTVCHVTDTAGAQLRPLPGPAWVVYAPPAARVAAA